MRRFATWQQETGTLATGCDVKQVVSFTMKQDERSMFCIALNGG